jgi:galactoside O-acetyltransferase
MLNRIIRLLKKKKTIKKIKKQVKINKNSLIDWYRIQLLEGSNISIGADSKIMCAISGKKNCILSIGSDCQILGSIVFDKDGGNITIGDRTYIGESNLISAMKIIIGNDVIISWGVSIVDHNSHSIYWDERKSDVNNWAKGLKDWSNVKMKEIKISDKVWIGFNAVILKGVIIGEGAVVGACSVVTKDVPPYTVVAGNPAKIIKMIEKNGNK